MSTTPWQRAEVPGPKRGLPLQRSETLISLLNKSKNPLLIIGHKAAEIDLGKRKLIDYLIDLARGRTITVVATAHTIKELTNRGFQNASSMPLMDIANRLRDTEWRGLDGTGAYDLVLFAGFPYYMAWLVFSGLKHMSSQLKTISLDGQYQPNASLSIQNVSPSELEKFFVNLLEKMGEM
ncbi:MAG: CO dehydrogenase/acetyl-CoA synthase complex subunit epsilon [Candidatus Bathyarchaeia archaeon]